MKRKITRLARGAKWGMPRSPPEARKSGWSSDAKASAPRPPAERPNRARRVSKARKEGEGFMVV